ncbi:MAG: DUF177 domain-containing protein [Slackia sp.]|nr:DUF177 domain-containing protein [Slackia sp.]
MTRLVIEVPSELFSPAESSLFDGVFDPEEFSCGPDTYVAQKPLSYHVVLTNVGGAILVTGTVEGALLTSCGRCLDDMAVEIEGEVEGYFLIEGEGEAPEDMDEDEFDVLPESHEIDLGVLLMAAVLVDLPLVPLCDEDCKGMCARCGKNLNEGPCDCASDVDEDEAVGKNNPFAALKGISFD